MGKLSALKIARLNEPGRYPDGDGLMLIVGPNGSKSWIARLQAERRRRDIGLGSTKNVSLQEAREQLAAVRKQMKNGVDPVLERRRGQMLAITFRTAAEAFIKEQQSSWKSAKHGAQWTTTLESYAHPTLGTIPVTQITPPLIREAVLPIWQAKPETARRVLQRVGAVLDWACANGVRETGSPTDAVRKGLPRQVSEVEHFSAMPYADLPAFMRLLCNAAPTAGRLALRCLIFTAARSGEIRGARWSELDLERGLWSIPAERMKAGRAHQVTLSPEAVAAFNAAASLRKPQSDLVFPGTKVGKPLSDMTLTKLLRDAKLPYAAHGFRSTFRDWAADCTSFPREIAEAALAHVNPDRVEAAYRRTDFLAKRRELLDAWAMHCLSYTRPVGADLRAAA